MVECYSWLGQWKGEERGYMPIEGNFVRHADYLALVDVVRTARLEWAMACNCECAACDALHKRLQKMCGDVVTTLETCECLVEETELADGTHSKTCFRCKRPA